MKNRIVSLVFGAAFLLVSFTLMSFQQPVDTGDSVPIDPQQWTCYAFTFFPNGVTIRCNGTQSCTTRPTSVTCDGKTKVCGATPVDGEPL